MATRGLFGLHFQRGSSLLEVLIALVVISIGLLGVAAGLVYSLKGNHSAYLRSQANILSYDLLETMRAYRTDALAGEFDDGCSGSTACAERANWDNLVAALLPGSATVNVATSVTRPTGDEVQISITWSDARGAVTDDKGATTSDDPESQTFTLRTQL